MKIGLHSLFVLLTLGAVSAHGVTLSPCAEKEAKISKEIAYAKTQGNSYRVAGLEKALIEVKTHCTDSGVIKASQDKLAEKQQKVAEREKELREAEQNGDTHKIAKKQKKLQEAREEWKEAKNALFAIK